MNSCAIGKSVLLFLVLSLFVPEFETSMSLAAGKPSGTKPPGWSPVKDDTVFIYSGQPVYFAKTPGTDLHAGPEKQSEVKRRIEPDALLVKISSSGEWTRVFVPTLLSKGYVRTHDLTDSVLTPQEYADRTLDAAKEARKLVLEQFRRSPSIGLMEKAARFSFISEKDMLSFVYSYRGDISRLPFRAVDSVWALPVDGLPKVAVRSCGPDSAGASLFSDTSRVVLLGAAPFVQKGYCSSLPDSVQKKILDPNGVYLESSYFYEGLRLLSLVRGMTKDPVMVTHNPPFYDSDIKVDFYGVGSFVHTFPRPFPVTLLTKNGYVSGTLVSISHSQHVCPCHGVGDHFIVKSPLPSENSIIGILIGFQRPSGVKPLIRKKANGGWTADLDGDGKPDLKCVVREENNDDHLIHSSSEVEMGCYYYVKKSGIWYLTDARLEPMCT